MRVTPRKMRDCASRKAIGTALSSNRLLPYARDHLCNVNRRAFGATGSHCKGCVAWMQGLHASLANHIPHVVENALDSMLHRMRTVSILMQ
jgi:hypothetical protein